MHAGDGSEGVAGEAVTPAPAVKVTDAEGRVVPGAAVAFAVTAGGGSVSGATQSTNNDGIATVTSWVLGTTAGANTLQATVEGLTPVEFTATGAAGPPDVVAKQSPDAIEWNIGTAVTPPPRVLVTDQHGNPVQGASVTFAVASGGGNASGTAQTTNAAGEASVGSWTLGNSPGTNTLTATVGSLPAATFSMTGVDMCAQSPDYALGATVAGTLTTGDCLLFSGFNVDHYTLQRGGATAVKLDLTSTEIDTRLMLFANPETALLASSSSSMNATMRIIAPDGNPPIGASSTATGVNGAYTLTSTGISESMTNCVTAVLFGELTTSQSIQSTDCVDAGGAETFYLDVFIFFAEAGRTYTVALTTSAFDPYFEIQTLSGSLTHSAFATGSGELTADVSFTLASSSYRVILASTVNTVQTGAYALSVTSTAAGANADRGLPADGARTRVSHKVVRRALQGVAERRR